MKTVQSDDPPRIRPVLMCGGSGTRLWPLSRQSFPKQFAPILGDDTLLQSAARRFDAPGFAPPIAVTSDAFRFIVREQLESAGLAAEAILLEPEGRNTGPAGLAAALWAARQAPDDLVLLAAADHVIPDAEGFRTALRLASGAAVDGRIVTVGIAPTRPETGYGWLEVGEALGNGCDTLRRFVEKPAPEEAARLLADGGFLWNAGLFLARADVLVAAFDAHAPEMARATRAAVDGAKTDLSFHRLDPAAWVRTPGESIDFAVMEHADNLAVVRYEGAWSDLGSWEAVWQEMPADADGNALSGDAVAIDCSRSLLRSDAPGQQLVGLGLEDIVAVAMRDAVLVARRDRAQDVKQVVRLLSDNGAPQARQLPVDHRPWGWFETLILADRFQVKRICVKPGAALSLQSHVHRAEHWVVVAGTARVTVDDTARLLSENQSVYIPLGSVHRLENPGKVPVVVVEVQTGTYLGEDDIVRYDDAYARG